MATTAPKDRATDPHSPTTDGQSPTPPPKLRRQPAVIVGGVLAVAVGALLGSWIWSSATDSHQVLAARLTIHRGEVITAEDVQRVRVDGDLGAHALPGS